MTCSFTKIPNYIFLQRILLPMTEPLHLSTMKLMNFTLRLQLISYLHLHLLSSAFLETTQPPLSKPLLEVRNRQLILFLFLLY